MRRVEVGDDGNGAGRAQFGTPVRIAGHREDTESVAHERQQAHADVAATDDQQARTLEGRVNDSHPAIVRDSAARRPPTP
jgi:hypothetical protein